MFEFLRLVTVVAVGWACTSLPALDDGNFLVSYSLASSQVSQFEPVVVQLTLENHVGSAVTVDLGAENFEFTVLRPDGAITKVHPPVKSGFSPGGPVRIEAGQVYRQDLIVGGWFSFDMPGPYRISAKLLSPASASAQVIVPDVSGADLSLTVGSRDQQRLQRICAELSNKILSARSFTEAEDAAKALATVRDPIAVPYLLKPTGGWHLEPIRIAALANIGDDNAINALMALLKDTNSDARALSQSALMRLQSKTSDANLKKKIGIALRDAH